MGATLCARCGASIKRLPSRFSGSIGAWVHTASGRVFEDGHGASPGPGRDTIIVNGDEHDLVAEVFRKSEAAREHERFLMTGGRTPGTPGASPVKPASTWQMLWGLTMIVVLIVLFGR